MVSNCENKQTGNTALMKSRNPQSAFNKSRVTNTQHVCSLTHMQHINTCKHAAILLEASAAEQHGVHTEAEQLSGLQAAEPSSLLLGAVSQALKGSSFTEGNLAKLYITRCSSAWSSIRAFSRATYALPCQLVTAE